jgi:group I intron endonuclease
VIIMDLIKNFSSGIYCIKCMVDGKEYIGQAKNIYKRNYHELSALNNNISHNSHLQHAWNKHGTDNFSLSILFDNLSVSQLDNYEQMAILLRGMPDHSKGYNDTPGGHTGIITKEIRKKMSDSHLKKNGGVKPSKEVLEDLYINQGLNRDVIGVMFGVSDGTIYNYLKECDIPIKKMSDIVLERSGGTRASKDDLIELYVNRGLTLDQVASEFDVCVESIRNWLKEYDMTIRSRSEAHLNRSGGIKPSKEVLIELYINQGLSTHEIGPKFGVSHSTIHDCLKEYDIPIRSVSEANLMKKGGIRASKDDLIEFYVNRGLNLEETGKEFNVNAVTICNWLLEYDMPIRSRSEAWFIKNGAVKPSKDKLIDLYINQHLSQVKVAKECGISTHVLKKCLKEYDIPIRSQSESITHYHQNKHIGDSN